jgi:hypothetical protein
MAPQFEAGPLVHVVHSTGAGVKVPPTAEISTLRRFSGSKDFTLSRTGCCLRRVVARRLGHHRKLSDGHLLMTRVTNVRLAFSTRPVTSQQPAVEKMRDVA